MPTIFARIDVSLQGGDLSARLAAQVAKLKGLAATVTGLINSPPQSLGDLGRAINELPLPNLTVSGDFATALNAVRTAVPADLTSVTGGLIGGLQQLGLTIESTVARLVNESLGAILALYRLTQIDLTCSEEDHAGGGPPGPPPPPPPPPGPGDPLASSPTGLAVVSTQLDATHTLLAAAPSPFNVEGVLAWLRDATRFPDRNLLLPLPLPFLDDWIDPLQTLHVWKGMTPAEIRGHMAASLQDLSTFIRATAAGLLSALAADLTATAGHLSADALAQIADDLTASLTQLRAAVTSGDLTGTGPAVAQLTARLDEYDALRPTLQADLLGSLPALNGRLKGLTDDLTAQMSRLLVVLQPGGSSELPEEISTPPAGPDATALATLDGYLRPIADWVRDLARHLDLKAVQQPLKAATDGARGAVDGLDQGLAGVTLQVRSIFGQVESLLAQVDTQALVNQVKAAIQTFAAQLKQQLQALFQPARDAVAQVVQSIHDGVDGFNPKDVLDPLQQAIASLEGVLKDSEVVGAVANIRGLLETVKGQVEQLSFAPLTDQVIAAIDEVAQALKSIDPSKLNPAAQVALQAALAVLPASLTPLTDPLIVDFGTRIDTGPVPLLETVKQQPQKLLDKVQSFQPAVLVGAALGQPFQSLVQQLEAFKPSKLLQPVEGELGKLKDRLRRDANPGAPLKVLEQPFNQLLQAFDRLKPDDLVKPLEAAITGTVDKVLKVLPADAVFEQVDAVLATVQDVVTFGQRLVKVLDKLHGLVEGLANSRSQVETWIDSILDKIEAMGDAGPLQPRFVDVSAALDTTRAAALTGGFQAAAGPLLATLNTLDPQTRLAALVQAYAAFPRAALAALPASPQKTAVTAALGRLNPLELTFSAPYQTLATYRQDLTQAQSSLQETLAGWDARYHSDDSSLAGFRVAAATPAELRQWVQDALKGKFLQPFQLLFGMIEPVRGPLGTVLAVLRDLVAALESKLDDLLLGPDSLGGIRDALQQLVDRLRGFNLDFLRDSLKDLFAELRGKVEAVNPAGLRQEVETAFNDMLNTITFSQLIPPAAVAQLDQDYAGVVTKLKTLDPGKLVVELIQPEFEATIPPLLAAFDLTPVLEAIIGKLRGLDDELKQELGRVNQAYQDLRGAVPSLDLSVSVDIGISL